MGSVLLAAAEQPPQRGRLAGEPMLFEPFLQVGQPLRQGLLAGSRSSSPAATRARYWAITDDVIGVVI